MRPSKIAFVSVVMSVGCAAPLTNLQRAEQEYQQAQTQQEWEAAEAAAAQEEADAAARAEAEAGNGLSAALLTDAEEKAAMVAGILDRAEEQRKRACTLNPDMEGCKKAPPEVPPPPLQKVDDPPPQVKPPAPSHVDIQINDFSLTGINRLTDYPSGWKVGFDGAKSEVYLEVSGVRKYGYSKPANFKPVCLRFGATAATLCPAVPPTAPAPPPLPPASP